MDERYQNKKLNKPVSIFNIFSGMIYGKTGCSSDQFFFLIRSYILLTQPISVAKFHKMIKLTRLFEL
jgi:hypothetical protein